MGKIARRLTDDGHSRPQSMDLDLEAPKDKVKTADQPPVAPPTPPPSPVPFEELASSPPGRPPGRVPGLARGTGIAAPPGFTPVQALPGKVKRPLSPPQSPPPKTPKAPGSGPPCPVCARVPETKLRECTYCQTAACTDCIKKYGTAHFAKW